MRLVLAALLACALATPLAAASYSNVQFSHDGKRVIAVGPKPGDLSVWEVKNPGTRRTLSLPGQVIDRVLVAGASDKVATHATRKKDHYLSLIDIASMRIDHEIVRAKKGADINYANPNFLTGNGGRLYFSDATMGGNHVAYVDFAKDKDVKYDVSLWVIDVVDTSLALAGTSGSFDNGFAVSNFKTDKTVYKKGFGCFVEQPKLYLDYVVGDCDFGPVRLFDVRDGERVSAFYPRSEEWFFERFGSYIIDSDGLSRYEIIETETGKITASVGLPVTGSVPLAAAGKAIVIRVGRGTLGLYDVETGKHLGNLATD